MHLDILQDCKIVSTNELEKMFQPLRSVAGNIYRVSCTKCIYVHSVKPGAGVGTFYIHILFDTYYGYRQSQQ